MGAAVNEDNLSLDYLLEFARDQQGVGNPISGPRRSIGKCHSCGHEFHGLHCSVIAGGMCTCPTSYVEGAA